MFGLGVLHMLHYTVMRPSYPPSEQRQISPPHSPSSRVCQQNMQVQQHLDPPQHTAKRRSPYLHCGCPKHDVVVCCLRSGKVHTVNQGVVVAVVPHLSTTIHKLKETSSNQGRKHLRRDAGTGHSRVCRTDGEPTQVMYAACMYT